MLRPIQVFVSYGHEDVSYLGDDSLLGFLRGLEKEGVDFWTDRQITAGEIWDDVIKGRIAESDIALVLVSQWFLDSPYCTVEISGFLAKAAVVVPVLLSPCEWERHDWLKSRQFLPGDGKTILSHYQSRGDREGLFLEIRDHLRRQVEKIRAVEKAAATSVKTLAVSRPDASSSATLRPELTKRARLFPRLACPAYLRKYYTE